MKQQWQQQQSTRLLPPFIVLLKLEYLIAEYINNNGKIYIFRHKQFLFFFIIYFFVNYKLGIDCYSIRFKMQLSNHHRDLFSYFCYSNSFQ